MYTNELLVDDESNVIQKRTQDVTQTLDSIKHLKDQGEQRGDMRHAARIPLAVWFDLCQRLGIDNPMGLNKDELKRVYRALNGNEFNQLRVWEGKL